MNMMIEVDILLIKQIELKYLSKIKIIIFVGWMIQLPLMSSQLGYRHTNLS